MADDRELFGSTSLKTPPALVALAVLCAGMLSTSVGMIFFYAPTEKTMGFVQKIFYFHVPSAFMMFLSVLVMAVASVGYLVKKSDAWDRASDASVELAIMFGLLVLISGPLWGRKAWGVFWVWDVRLTSTLILVLTLVACKIVRHYAGPSAKTIAAALAVLAVLNSIFVYVCVKFWRTTHPPQIPASDLDPAMRHTLQFAEVTFVFVWSALFWARQRLGRLRTGLDRLYMRATEAGLHD